MLVKALTDGLETGLGRWFKGGVELSGGQWQKIALARAFMRERADILVLDEPTAALDAEAEHAVFERFRAGQAGQANGFGGGKSSHGLGLALARAIALRHGMGIALADSAKGAHFIIKPHAMWGKDA